MRKDRSKYKKKIKVRKSKGSNANNATKRNTKGKKTYAVVDSHAVVHQGQAAARVRLGEQVVVRPVQRRHDHDSESASVRAAGQHLDAEQSLLDDAI